MPPAPLICSFFTEDEYYRGHAQRLRQNLDDLGIDHHIVQLDKAEGEDWADICRKKVAFLADRCEQNPEATVFWIDVDCGLLELPEYVRSSTADIVGFQRGFGSPLTIGYANRTRFWEPCFFGITGTPGGRRFIADAARLEQNTPIKATDDYFFEEAWRHNAAKLTFQVLPSLAVLSRATASPEGVTPFFVTGSSGNVEKFKDRVVQHDRIGATRTPRVMRRVRQGALRVAKVVERSLPDTGARSLRRVADLVGLTHVLTGGNSVSAGNGSAHRNRILREVIAAGQRGDLDAVDATFGRLVSSGMISEAEIAAKEAATSFARYARPTDSRPDEGVVLSWWCRPLPGNFGDWLSPLLISQHQPGQSGPRPVIYHAPTAPTTNPHLIAVGSIGRFIKPSSIVVGTGIASTDMSLERRAEYISVRGPLTAQHLIDCGGPAISAFGDPGLLVSRIFPLARPERTNGRIALVRHFTHRNLPISIAENMDELSVLVSHPDSIKALLGKLIEYDAIVTSAMHVMIAAHSYGIPCALVTFEGFEDAVHGSGIKYRDYCLGAGMDHVWEPTTVSRDLLALDLDSLIRDEQVDASKLDEIADSLTEAVGVYRDCID